MADVQPENGYTRIADELLENIPYFKLNGTQLRIIMVVLRYTYGFNRKDHEMSLSFFCNGTGLGKTQVDREVKQLITKNVLIVTRESNYTQPRKLGINKDYETWKVEYSQQESGESAKTLTDSENADEQSANLRTRTVSENADQDIHSLNTILNTVSQLEEEDLTDSEIMKRSVEVEKHYCTKRGLWNCSAKDFHEIKLLVACRIPVEFINTSMDLSFANYQPRYPKDEIRAFLYCATACRERWATHLEKVKPVPRGGQTDAKHQSSHSGARSGRDSPESKNTSITGGQTGRIGKDKPDGS